MKYPLGYNTWNKEEKKSAIKVLDSGFFTMGKKVKEFEEKFAKNFGSKYATMVNSGSSANLLMLSVLKNYKKIIKKKQINQILLHLLLDGVLHTIQYLKIILK